MNKKQIDPMQKHLAKLERKLAKSMEAARTALLALPATPLTTLERELKAARSLEKLLASMPKKLNVKPEPTFKPNPHLPGAKL